MKQIVIHLEKIMDYGTNKTTFKSFDDTWSSDLLDMNDYGPKKDSGQTYILVVIDNFSKFGGTILLKNSYAQTITEAFSQILKTSKRQPNLIETENGSEFVNKLFTNLSENNNIER